jgi:transposase-like protein
MGGESAEAWRSVLADLIGRGLRRPEFLIVDEAGGLDSAIATVWGGVQVQRCVSTSTGTCWRTRARASA